MREKKMLYVFLLLTAFLASVVCTIPIGLAQDELPTMFVDPAFIEDPALGPGAMFTVSIVVDHVEALWAYQYELTFNPDVLQGIYYDDTAIPPIPVEESGWLGSLGGLVIQSPGLGWDNVNGKLKLTGASVLNPMTMQPDPAYCPTATEKTILSIVAFEVVGYGESPLVLGLESALLDSDGVYIIKRSLPMYQYQFVDGYFGNRLVRADLVRHSAWPEHHHFDISRDEDHIQTLFAKVKNMEAVDVYVKVVFSLVAAVDGTEYTVEAVYPSMITQGEIVDLSKDFVPQGEYKLGKYSASTQCFYSTTGEPGTWRPGVKIKSFSFTIVP